MKFANLKKIKVTTHINSITDGQISELQTALSILGYPVGQIDGLIGPKTKNAWAEFKTDVFIGNPELIGMESIEALREKINKIERKTGHDFKIYILGKGVGITYHNKGLRYLCLSCRFH